MPHSDLRRFALAVYADDGVSPACLLLQDRTGVDVNVMFFAAFVGAVHGRRIGAEDLETVRTAVGDWHAEVVRPLRAVRRRLKSGPAPAPDESTAALRQRLQKVEIEAEIIELDVLGALVGSPPAAPGGDAHEHVAANVASVLESLGATIGAQERLAIATIARSAVAHAQRV